MTANSATGWRRWAYAGPAFALAFVGIPIYVFLPKFYTDVVGVDIALVGWIMLAARMFDAVTDPAIGALSDATRTRFGRRRPYIIGASLPLAATIYFLLNPPASASPEQAATWFAGWLFAMFVFWTVLVVPYESLGAELTFDYHERTTLLATRDGLLVAGTVVAAAAPLIVAKLFGLGSGPSAERSKFFWVAALYAPLLVVLCGWCVVSLREPAATVVERRGWRHGLEAVLANRPFAILLAAYTLGSLAFNLAGGLLLYYVRYVLISDDAELYLVIYLLSGVICLPLWVRASHKLGKRAVWLIGMATYTVGGSVIFFLGAGDGAIYALLCFVTGMTFGPTVAIPASMQADVIDYDEVLSGQRREGLYIGMWSVVRKLAAALGVGIALPILEAVGYQPNVEQTEPTKLTLRLLYVGVPVVCNVAAMVIAWRYPIDRAAHLEIRAQIDARRAAAVVRHSDE